MAWPLISTHLQHGELVVDEDGQPRCGDDQELCPEGVVVGVVRGTELEEDEVAGGEDRDNEDDLHDRVVDRDEVSGQVQVASDEHHSKQHLALARDTCTAAPHATGITPRDQPYSTVQ